MKIQEKIRKTGTAGRAEPARRIFVKSEENSRQAQQTPGKERRRDFIKSAEDKAGQYYRRKWQSFYREENNRAGFGQRKKLPWEQSEALYHFKEYGVRQGGPDTALTGIKEKKTEHSSAGGMREIFKAENSYGSIAAGVNQKHEAAVTFSQKREHDGPAAVEAQKKVLMQRSKREILPAGNMYLNPGMEKEGAAAFIADARLPARRAFGQVRRFSDEKGSRMLEKRMPFLRMEKEKNQLRRLEEIRRGSREAGNDAYAGFLEERISKFRSRLWQQEQAQRQMMKKLRDAWEQAERMPGDGFRRQEAYRPQAQMEQAEDARNRPQSEDGGTQDAQNRPQSEDGGTQDTRMM